MKIYVASSWRNNYQPGVVTALRQDGHQVYDFKGPGDGWGGAGDGPGGFGWKEMGWACGSGRFVAVYMPEIREPDLMVKMADYVGQDLEEIRRLLVMRSGRIRSREQRAEVRKKQAMNDQRKWRVDEFGCLSHIKGSDPRDPQTDAVVSESSAGGNA